MRRCVRGLQEADKKDRDRFSAIEAVRSRGFEDAHGVGEFESTSRVAVSVLCDFAHQGWSIRATTHGLRIERPQKAETIDAEAERARIRESHAVERDVQLKQRSVRQFILSMERRRLGPKGWVSIFSLMRDGRDLAEQLRFASQQPSQSEREDVINQVVRPYIQVVEGDTTCSETGMRLGDIWRYFRHTWANQYHTVPGRNISFLIRDAAVEYHPVIGVASLTSPVVHLKQRDEWIGWAPKQFVYRLQVEASDAWAKWVSDSLKSLFDDIYIKDFIKEGIIKRTDLTKPSEKVISLLRNEAEQARDAHRRYPEKSQHKTPTNGKRINWRKRAETYLFRWKRAEALAELMETRMRLQRAGFKRANKSDLVRALSSADGRRAVEIIRRKLKAIHVGNHVLDVSICGAVPPYNEILGGKLVAMLLTSPEVAKIYEKKYSGRGSIIASSTAGREVSRKPKLLLMTTTSLYGAMLSQYTRIKIPAQECGSNIDDSVTYQKLGLTIGQGSHHISARTVDEMEVLLAQRVDGRRVNSIFGEGVSPRLRKIRAGLDLCGFPSDYMLKHGSPRVIYGVALTRNFQNLLVGKDQRPKYILPRSSPKQRTEQIARYWARRWVLRRIQRADVIDAIETQTLVHPIRHNARVNLPELGEHDNSQQEFDLD